MKQYTELPQTEKKPLYYLDGIRLKRLVAQIDENGAEQTRMAFEDHSGTAYDLAEERRGFILKRAKSD